MVLGLGRGRRGLCEALVANVVPEISVGKATGSRSVTGTGASFIGVTGSRSVAGTGSV